MTDRVKENDMEQQRDNWTETAAQYARNADYWRDRAHRAERFTFQRAWWFLARALRNHGSR